MRTKLTTATIFSSLLLIAQYTHAADEQGAFAVKGAGISSCSRFIESAKNKDQLYYVYGGWIEGYLSASNQHLSNTYDLAPWQSTRLMLKIIESACTQNPKSNFQQILSATAADMSKQRITKGENFIDIDGKRNYVYQEEVIRRMKQALKNKSFYSGKIDGTYGNNLKAAVSAFQKSKNQEQTGYPDQGTLLELFKP